MSTLEEVRSTMKATGLFSDEALSGLTQESIDNGIKNSQAVPTGTGAAHILSTWTGNNFRIVNGVWYWDDKPGSQCGRDRTWNYTPRPGASYREAGRCPQGYPWFEMQIPA